MALPAQLYEFPCRAPTLEEVYRAVVETESAVTMEIVQRRKIPERPMTAEQRAYLVDLAARTRAKPRHKPVSETIVFAPQHLELRTGRDRLTIHVSTDSRMIFVFGGNCGPELFKSACDALERLGGRVKETVPRKTAS